MRRLSLLAALALAGCTEGKPTGFGVNLTVDTTLVKDQVVTFGLHVSGAETFDTEIDVSSVAASGEVRFHYVPGVTAGSLFFAIDGLDDARRVIGRGASGSVTLVEGTAVEAAIRLANGLGQPCKGGGECPSGHCADEVCCDSACGGPCEACNLAGKLGQCSAIADGTNPALECAGKGELVVPDSDGGVVELPDGAVVDTTPCSGTCSGSRACRYPAAGTSCGSAFCASDTQSATIACDGKGACAMALTGCIDFICGAGACKTLCNNNADCQPQDFCNLTIQKCVSKRDNGQMCTQAFECKSDVCAQGVCCNSQCDPPNQCNVAGKEGMCQCQGVTCPAGVACQLYYKDSDGDTFGDANGTVMNNGAKAGCVGSPPAGFPTSDHSDCDDSDSRAKPGQTSFFTTQRMGVGGFDFNCDTATTKQTVLAGATCGFCSFGGFPSRCSKNSTCSKASNQAALSCGSTKTPTGLCLCCITAEEGFVVDTACGTSTTSNYRICGTCAAAGGSNAGVLTSRTMGCR